jgi:hypothetical protein
MTPPSLPPLVHSLPCTSRADPVARGPAPTFQPLRAARAHPCPGGAASRRRANQPASSWWCRRARALRNQRRRGKRDPAARSVLKQVFSLGLLSVSLSHTSAPCRSRSKAMATRQAGRRLQSTLSLSRSTLGGGSSRQDRGPPGADRPFQRGSTSPARIWELRLPERWRAVDLQVATPRAANLMEGASAVVHGGENGLAGGLGNGLAGGLWAFF